MSKYQNDPLELFLYGIRSNSTKSRYKRRLGNFFDYLEISGDLSEQAKQFIGMAQKNGNTWVSANLMKYLAYHKERAERNEIAVGTLKNYYKPVKAFLEMNDIELSWKKITRGLPKGKRYASDRAPTVSEIQKLVEYPDRRIKAIVFTMCSSGIRLGAWDYLKWSHITPIKQDEKIIAAKILVYAGEHEEYISFISPEAYTELKKWMDFRVEYGEKITDNSWLMRDLWNVEKFARGLLSAPKQLKSLGIKRLMERALHAQGIRKGLQPGQKRYEFQADHGFRKFFKTHAEQVMRPINVEILMGHSTGVSDSYYRPNENELLSDYQNAIPELTVLKENRIALDSEKLQANSSDIQETKNEIANLKEEIRRINLKNEIAEITKSAMADWAAQNSDKIQPLQIAKADFRTSKGMNDMVEHFLKEHNGDISGLREQMKKMKVTIKD